MAFMTNAFASIVEYFWFPTADITATIIFSLIILLAVFALMTRSINIGAGVNFAIWSFGMFCSIVWIILMVSSSGWTAANWQPFFAFGTSGFITGTALMITMYFGFELIPQFAEECNYPHEKHWNIMTAAIVSAMALYIAVVLTENGAMNLTGLLSYPNFLAAILAQNAYGTWLAVLIGLGNIAILMGCIIGFFLGSARVMYSMARDKVFPTIFLKLSKKNQPWVANILIFLVAVFFILNAGSNWIVDLYTMMAIGIAIAYTATCAAFIRLRYTIPDHPRPWRTPGGVGMGVVATIAGLVIIYYVFYFFLWSTWVLFILYFVIGFVVRILLYWDEKRHPEQFVREALADKI
jgi:APA family basic amino acid/polyamine antiporter